jgi:hypothetical protein
MTRRHLIFSPTSLQGLHFICVKKGNGLFRLSGQDFKQLSPDEKFSAFFSFKKLKKGKKIFNHHVKTDGVSCSVLFTAEAKESVTPQPKNDMGGIH